MFQLQHTSFVQSSFFQIMVGIKFQLNFLPWLLSTRWHPIKLSPSTLIYYVKPTSLPIASACKLLSEGRVGVRRRLYTLPRKATVALIRTFSIPGMLALGWGSPRLTTTGSFKSLFRTKILLLPLVVPKCNVGNSTRA